MGPGGSPEKNTITKVLVVASNSSHSVDSVDLSCTEIITEGPGTGTGEPWVMIMGPGGSPEKNTITKVLDVASTSSHGVHDRCTELCPSSALRPIEFERLKSAFSRVQIRLCSLLSCYYYYYYYY